MQRCVIVISKKKKKILAVSFSLRIKFRSVPLYSDCFTSHYYDLVAENVPAAVKSSKRKGV